MIYAGNPKDFEKPWSEEDKQRLVSVMETYSKYVPKCFKCKTVSEYDGLFDAQFCPQCNEWLEDICDDPECDYCRYRPETPNGQSSNK